jgi:hypothetical protein
MNLLNRLKAQCFCVWNGIQTGILHDMTHEKNVPSFSKTSNNSIKIAQQNGSNAIVAAILWCNS